ncbi:hypothetical protein SUGI_0403510 [Cryptomeria japonica]|uniref:uncharacterized protein LOC131077386 n=1 Tax=Cryptomeria japonica TaxID=3369 RepID=UPI002408F112|nr:uncharacterized protein LOC131077386 [Cryptomeria japonica]GLJ21663.1 hypothetical protein SUGI_0403510 [Cryptomeria japonica]
MDDENGKTRKRKGPCHATESSGFDLEEPMGFALKKIGAGLANLGNTCFLNSVLQCLTYTEPLAAYLQSGRHKIACRASGFCAMCAIQNHVMNALSSSGKILSPSHLVKHLPCISRSFRISRQEDAHEYMVMLMESMHRCSLPSGIVSESPSAYEKSLVHKIFGGRLRSQVKCRQCSHCSNTYEPFLDLSLEISQSDSLLKMLSNFTAVEQLEGGEKIYECERCKVKVQAVKQFTVDKVPHVLAIHLKRFDSMGGKINKKVEFGRTLNMKPFVSGQQEGSFNYTLYGVLVHAGRSTYSGHYYCFIRTSTGNWHALDDNRVYKVNEQVVLEQKAYMLFYVRDKQTINQLSVNSKHQGKELKHNKSTSLNATFKMESPLSVSSVQSIPKMSSCLNSNGTTVSRKVDRVLRKETMLDDYSACKGAEAGQNVNIHSLPKLPLVSNSDMLENDGESQGTAIMVNSSANDPVTYVDCNMGKDLENDTADNGEKTSTHLGKAIADDQHEIVKNLGNDDIIDHAHSNGHSAVENLMNGDKFVVAAAKVPQVTKIPGEVHMNHHVTVREGNDAQASISGDILNHRNGTALPLKENFDGVPRKIEILDFSKTIKESNNSLQKQDSICHLHDKRFKFQRLVGYSKLAMPLSRRFLLHTALGISRNKRLFKRKKQSHLQYNNLPCSTSSGSTVKSANSLAHLQNAVVERGSKTDGQHIMSTENCFLNSFELNQNHESMISSVQNGSAFTKIEETHLESHLLSGSAQTSSRQICSQHSVCKRRNPKHNAEQPFSGTCVGISNDQTSTCNVNDCGQSSVLLDSLQHGNVPTCNLSTRNERNPVKFCVNSASSNIQDQCGQRRETVPKNAILYKTSLESDRAEIDRFPYEKEARFGYIMDGWAEEYDSSKNKRVKLCVDGNAIIYDNKRQVDECNNSFQAVVASRKVKIRKLSRRNIATTGNKPS